MKPNYLIAIVGPTAIGKTALSIKLAEAFSTEIISADSRQFFKEMTIGTAAPTEKELLAAKHHFIHHKSIQDAYSVGRFEKEAIDQLTILFKANDIAIMVGGSGLYVDAVTKGLDTFPKVSSEIREQLNDQLKEFGLSRLQAQLKDLDPVSYLTIEMDNPHRVIRALEICIGSGKPYSSFLKGQQKNRPFETLYIGLEAPRAVIYDRINQRVDQMMTDGLLKEVESLYPYKNLNALNTVGYKELFNYLDGEWTLDFAISEIKKNTRRFAKRQLTWYRKNASINWFNYETDPDVITEFITQKTAKDV